tara:strand:- start:260 stop:508 length:249 start_codon:yes stop_codon:yes gene_type:complete
VVFRPFFLDASDLMQLKKWQPIVEEEVSGKHSLERRNLLKPNIQNFQLSSSRKLWANPIERFLQTPSKREARLYLLLNNHFL